MSVLSLTIYFPYNFEPLLPTSEHKYLYFLLPTFSKLARYLFQPPRMTIAWVAEFGALCAFTHGARLARWPPASGDAQAAAACVCAIGGAARVLKRPVVGRAAVVKQLYR